MVTLSQRCAIWYLTCSIQWPWNPGYGTLKVIGTDTDRSSTYDFLLTFHSNHGPILYRFRDKWRFRSKIAKFSHPLYFASALKRFPLELGTSTGLKKLEWCGYRAVKEIWRYPQPSGYNTPTWRTDTGWQQRPRVSTSHNVMLRDTKLWLK